MFRFALPVFAIALWAFTTLGLGGQLGRSTDDWSFSLIDPVTGKPPSLSEFDPWNDKPYFWRPVHQVFLFFVRTYLDDYDRGIHTFVAAMHGLVCLLLYRLVRNVSGSRSIAAAGSLLFMACPLHHEVALWFCTTSTAIGAALFLWLCLAMVRWSRGPTTSRSWLTLAPMTVIAFAIPFFYEQPGATIAALPCLYFAACSPDQPLRTRLARALGSTFILGLTQVAFVTLMIATAGRGDRGSVARMVGFDELPARSEQIRHMLHDMLIGDGARIAITGSAQIGWRVATTSIAWVWLAILSLTALACIIAAARRNRVNDLPPPDRGDEREREQGREEGGRAPRLGRDVPLCVHPLRLVWFGLFGILVASFAILPVAMVRGQTFPPRTLYVPLLGITLLLAAAASFTAVTAQSFWRARPLRALGTIVVLVAATAGGICMLGMQRVYQRSSSLDARMVSTLAALVPNPPPNALFVPIALNARAARTGMPRFDRLRPGVFETYWSAGPPLRRTLRRSDIYASSRNPWAPHELSGPTTELVRIAQRAMPEVPIGVREGDSLVVPWSRIIPFTIEPDGDARIVGSLTFESEDGSTLDVRPAIVAQLLKRGELAQRDAVHADLDSGSPVNGLSPLTGWKWADGREVLDATPVVAWRESTPPRLASWLHPSTEEGHRAKRSVTLPASPTPRRVVLHAVLTEHDLRRAPNAQSVKLVIELNDAAQAAPFILERRDFLASRRWKMFVVDVPASDRPTNLTVHVEPASDSTNPNPLPCWVSMGNLVAQPPR